MSAIMRVFVEKQRGYDVEARGLLTDLRENLGIRPLNDLRLLNRYDVAGLSRREFELVQAGILYEPAVDCIFEESLPLGADEIAFAIEYLPGQYDQRADSAAQCIQLVTKGNRPRVVSARVVVLQGDIDERRLETIKMYLINPVDSREAAMEKPRTLTMPYEVPDRVPVVIGFIDKERKALEEMQRTLGLAMGMDDLLFCQKYFRLQEKRNPTLTEIKMLDTYWSDHCRHTTFSTRLKRVTFAPGSIVQPIRDSYRHCLRMTATLREKRDGSKGNVKNSDEDLCLMDIATLSMKELRARGELPDLEVSNEVNACSIIRDVDVGGESQEWLILFKNETHNHPTEIEPFGGAATCLGGAIRDPLSGRAYVYQAMRVTGSGDPRQPVSKTLPGKLPQRKITTEAAHGYSSYGNQIGLATGQVSEIYHPGYVSKRMEVGAVVGAVPRHAVVREEPEAGDIVLLVGGRTGRDGIGGATGSSKKHTETSILTAGAEVQKGNPPEERKLQRLFRQLDVCRMIKKCNDFGAGGVSVAVGELTAGVDIDLDRVPKKYEGLDGTELALSESQERMAVVIAPADVERFKRLAHAENLEATEIATVTDSGRLKMIWNGQVVVDIARDFIDTHGVVRETTVLVECPEPERNYFQDGRRTAMGEGSNLKDVWLSNLEDLNVCGQMGLVERFDSTIGAGSVLLPLGGKYQRTPTEAMVAKLPVLDRETETATVMAYGYDPFLADWSPYHGGVYAVVEATAKVVATGGDYSTLRFSLQEYFEKLGEEPRRWGKPLAALLGAYRALTELGVAAIGGKDSMSGSFEDIHVPPTLIAFGLTTMNVNRVISPEFKKPGNTVVWAKIDRDRFDCPDFAKLKERYALITRWMAEGKAISAGAIRVGGIAAAISRMAFGNRLGFDFSSALSIEELLFPDIGGLVLELDASAISNEDLEDSGFTVLGRVDARGEIRMNGTVIGLEEAFERWRRPLEGIFPTRPDAPAAAVRGISHSRRRKARARVKIARPRVLVTAFPGTNCEYDTERAFRRAGAITETLVFRNLTPGDIALSLKELRQKILESEIIAIPGGFSAGDEPDGSGKFITAVFRNPGIQDAVMEFLRLRDGLILGICNGFQALVKLGLIPYGDIRRMEPGSPTLTFNTIGRHVSRLVATRVVSVMSPWFIHSRLGDMHVIPVSHGEGRFVAPEATLERLASSGQIAVQYVDEEGNPCGDFNCNPNGSQFAVEAVTSPDGKVLGKMAHSERTGHQVCKNIPGNKEQGIFRSGVDYFA